MAKLGINTVFTIFSNRLYIITTLNLFKKSIRPFRIEGFTGPHEGNHVRLSKVFYKDKEPRKKYEVRGSFVLFMMAPRFFLVLDFHLIIGLIRGGQYR